MKIVTVNIPEAYLDSIEKLVETEENPLGIYPSRSELVRCAVKEFLQKEIDMADYITKNTLEQAKKKFFQSNGSMVKVPTIRKDENGEPYKTFKTFKIIKRLI